MHGTHVLIAYKTLCILWLWMTPLNASECKSDRKCIREKMARSPIQQASFFESYAAPLSKRVFPAPKELVDFINLENQLQGFPTTTKSFSGDQSFRRDLQRAIEHIPALVMKKVDQKLLGIFLATGVGGTAYTDLVHNKKGEAHAGFIVLDTGVLQRKVNEWALWKENTVFKGSDDHTLRVQLVPSSDDSRVNALLFILLHELGHAMVPYQQFNSAIPVFNGNPHVAF